MALTFAWIPAPSSAPGGTRPPAKQPPRPRGCHRASCDSPYLPRYGSDWEAGFLDTGPVYARIDAETMFAFAIEGTPA